MLGNNFIIPQPSPKFQETSHQISNANKNIIFIEHLVMY